MDQLLPAPLPYLGTLVGIVVLMSASAASAQGLQNLALGLKERHYIPRAFGALTTTRSPTSRSGWKWGSSACVSCCLARSEETYLALYAAGVFILLSMTGWAVTKRLVREASRQFSIRKVA